MSDPNEKPLVKQQKYRATRVDPNYISRPHPLRRLMRILTIALPALGFLVLLGLTYNPFAAGGRQVYEPGPVSAQHSFFNHRCEDCHETQFNKFGLVSNSKCRVCHDGPLHSANQVCPNGEKLIRNELTPIAGSKNYDEKQVTHEEPRCASCHTEHKGSQRLVMMNDNHCTQCHADLKLQDNAKPGVTKSITEFSAKGGHDEWQILRPDPRNPAGNDPTPLRFNHKLHMDVSYDPDSRYGVRKMQCVDCHKSTETNLDPLCAETPRLKMFEEALSAEELNTFYDGVLANASANGIMTFKFTRTDIRKLAGDALATRDLGERLVRAGDKKLLAGELESAVIRLIRERQSNLPATGQPRYMLPITYERTCATECHWHRLPAVKLSDNSEINPLHGKASESRRLLRDAIFADEVKQALSPRAAGTDDKAARLRVKQFRDELAKMAGPAAMAGKDAAAVNAMLVETLNQKVPEAFPFVTGVLKPNETMAMFPGIIDQATMDKYATMKPESKARTKLNDSITEKLQALITSYAEERGQDLTSINAATDEKLADVSKRLYAPKEIVREKKERGACLFCHEPTAKVTATAEKSEIVADAHVPARWLKNAIFNHETHRVIDCESCHDHARKSDKTADVLLPGIQKCQECHKSGGARTDCIECHVFHDKSHQLRDRTVPIEDLMKIGAAGVKLKEPECSRAPAITPTVEQAPLPK